MEELKWVHEVEVDRSRRTSKLYYVKERKGFFGLFTKRIFVVEAEINATDSWHIIYRRLIKKRYKQSQNRLDNFKKFIDKYNVKFKNNKDDAH